jgi:hypothetical protein
MARQEWGDAWPPAGPHPYLFLLLPPNFFPLIIFPAYPSSGLPTPKPASSLSPTPPFSPPPTQLSHNSPVIFHSSQSSARTLVYFCGPPSDGHPARPTLSHFPCSGEHPPPRPSPPASSSFSTTKSLSSLRAGISPSPVCIQKISLHEQYLF